jgi:arylsulfatase A-like enzyme
MTDNVNTIKKNSLGLIFTLSIPLVTTAQVTQKPNIIIIYTDDQGTLDAGCYGARDLLTPNIDRLAAEGIRFTRFYGAPVSSVSRASLMTGQFSLRNKVISNVGGNNYMRSEVTTLPEVLKENGYNTALIGKWHLGSVDGARPNQQGFDYFFGHLDGCIDNYSHFFYWGGPNRHDLWRNETQVYNDGQYFPDQLIRELKNYINQNRSEPFFIYWASNMPHYPLQPRERWLEHYNAKKTPYPRNLYNAFLSTFDEIVGELLDFLENEELRENTIIVFQSDNGHSVEERNHFGGGYSGPYRAAKFSLFEGGIRVPAIISYPKELPQEEVRDQMAMNIDWFPTLLELCGVSYNQEEIDGKSLLPLIQESTSQSSHNVLFFDSGNQWAVMQDEWKLIYKPQDPTLNEQIIDTLYLTNIKEDIGEVVNYAEKSKDKVNELLQLRREFEAKNRR